MVLSLTCLNNAFTTEKWTDPSSVTQPTTTSDGNISPFGDSPNPTHPEDHENLFYDIYVKKNIHQY